MKKTRQQILNEARRVRAEMRQIFVDCAYWNEHVRQPDEEAIDPDPDGTLACALAYVEGILNGEVYLAREK